MRMVFFGILAAIDRKFSEVCQFKMQAMFAF